MIRLFFYQKKKKDFMQKLIIKKFGPVKELELDVKDFIVLIGPQASGKSTIAKTIFFFKSLNDELLKYFMDAIENNQFSRPTGTYAKMIRQRFLDFFGATTHMDSLLIKYYYSETVWIEITLEQYKKYVTPRFSKDFENGFLELVGNASFFAQSVSKKNPSYLTTKDLFQIDSDKKKYLSQVKIKIDHLFGESREIFFIPAGRSLLATLADQIHFINPRKLDFLMRSFVDKINLIKPVFEKSLFEVVNERKHLTQFKVDTQKAKKAEEIINKILKGKYRFDKDGEKIFINEGKYIKLNFASSGQQESLWILLLAFLLLIEQQTFFVVIEEPEAHLFPEAQKEISNLIALIGNQAKSQVLITTHSPYILASINNLIMAKNAGDKDPEKVSKRISKDLWIDYRNVFAGKVDEGIVTEILDNELRIIKSEEIDNASRIINDEFDFLFPLIC